MQNNWNRVFHDLRTRRTATYNNGASSETDSASRRELIKMSELAKRSGVPAATIKHYIREELLDGPALRTSPNMAYYDAALVPRIKTIKQLQRSQYLPLKVIKTFLETQESVELECATEKEAEAAQQPPAEFTFAEIVRAGFSRDELEDLEKRELVHPVGEGDDRKYVGSDVELLEVLIRASDFGFSASVCPIQLVKLYVDALRPLVLFELHLFRQGLQTDSTEELDRLTDTAAEISELLVTNLRRRLIMPALTQLLGEKSDPEANDSAPGLSYASFSSLLSR